MVFLFCLACQNKFHWKEPKIDTKRVVSFEVVKIDSVDYAYLIEGVFDDSLRLVLVSEKKENLRCKNRLEVGKTYTMKLNFESFAAGEYYGYNLFGKEYPLDTAISMDDRKLKGLCIK